MLVRCLAALFLVTLLSTAAAKSPPGTTWMAPPSSDTGDGWGVLGVGRQFGARQVEGAATLSGDWGGARSWLADRGVAFGAAYVLEAAGNPVGGRKHRARYTHNVDAAMFVDLEKLLSLPHTRFVASMSNRAGNSLSKDIPNQFAVQEIFGAQTSRLVVMAFETQLLDERLDLVAGRIDALDDFIASPLYCYAQNLGLCGNPLSIPIDVSVSSYPNTAWGARGRWWATDELYLMTGAYNTYAPFRANRFHGVDFTIHEDSGVASMNEIGWLPEISPGLRGHYKLGGWYDTEQHTEFRSGRQAPASWGLYTALDQRVFRSTGAHGLGITPFVALAWAPPDVNQQQWFLDDGVLWEGPIPGRPHDVLGLFGVYGRSSRDLRRMQRSDGKPGQTYEAILELNYRVDIFPWLYIQPDLQGVINPNATGRVDDALVLAVQLGVAL
ncbi:MAG TPA: carbohydrate porin [Candidatus Binatia bacterium]|jgi:porin|nr:carbohydrate porin [Candidatus Binatia bacterium]